MYRYKVLVNYKVIDRKASDYGCVLESARKFTCFSDAVAWIRDFRAMSNTYQMVGKPTVEAISQ
jgi:hypothetical protein